MRPTMIGLMSIALVTGCSDDPAPAPLGKAKIVPKTATTTPTQTPPEDDRPDALRAQNPSDDSTPETPEEIPEPGEDECAENLKKIQADANQGLAASTWEPTQSGDWRPDGTPGAEARDWDAGEAFASLNWQPEGQVRGSYKVTTTSDSYVVHCISDIDGDGVQSTWTVGASGDPGLKE